MTDVIIVGGGIAGLSTAYELARLDVSFVVLERAPRAGGVIFSESIDGYTIDGGPDSLLVQKPQAIALCEQLGLGDRLVATKLPRLAYIQRNRRLHPLPTGSVLGIPTRIAPFLETHLFSWPAKLRMGAELFVPPRRDEADESIGAFMTRRFGREATTYLAEPLLAGIHAGDVDRPVDSIALSAIRRSGEEVRQPAARISCSDAGRGIQWNNGTERGRGAERGRGPASIKQRRRVQVFARRVERDDRRARTSRRRRHGPHGHDGRAHVPAA